MNRSKKFIELFESYSVGEIQSFIKEFLNKFFKEFNLPTPNIKIKDNLGSRWLAQTVYAKNANNTTIEIQKSILDDELTLKRVLAHELIHHWQNLRYKMTDKEFDLVKLKQRYGIDTGHGNDFQEYASKINSIMGSNYVTSKSDEEYVQSQSKDFYLFIEPVGSDKFGWAWFQRPTQKMKNYIKDHSSYYKSRVFRSNDKRFLVGTILKAYGGVSVPKDQGTMDLLKNIYNNDKQIIL